jgi:hypothetical protein
MAKVLILSLPALIVFAYFLLVKSGLRRHADRAVERICWFAGVVFAAVLVLLFVKLPGTSQFADAMRGFLAWIHS